MPKPRVARFLLIAMTACTLSLAAAALALALRSERTHDELFWGRQGGHFVWVNSVDGSCYFCIVGGCLQNVPMSWGSRVDGTNYRCNFRWPQPTPLLGGSRDSFAYRGVAYGECNGTPVVIGGAGWGFNVAWYIVAAALGVLGAIPTAALTRKWVKRAGGQRAGRCVVCAYDLTGNVSGVCPECGTAAERRVTT